LLEGELERVTREFQRIQVRLGDEIHGGEAFDSPEQALRIVDEARPARVAVVNRAQKLRELPSQLRIQ
jgi:hypothetical protein